MKTKANAENMKKTAIWFSRHTPSVVQLTEIEAMGYELVDVEKGMAIGRMAINDENDLRVVLTKLVDLAFLHEAEACFGVFAAPVQEGLVLLPLQVGEERCGCDKPTWLDDISACEVIEAWALLGVKCYAAWNVQRSADGGKPTFEHKRFCRVGNLKGSRKGAIG